MTYNWLVRLAWLIDYRQTHGLASHGLTITQGPLKATMVTTPLTPTLWAVTTVSRWGSVGRDGLIGITVKIAFLSSSAMSPS